MGVNPVLTVVFMSLTDLEVKPSDKYRCSGYFFYQTGCESRANAWQNSNYFILEFTAYTTQHMSWNILSFLLKSDTRQLQRRGC